MGRNLGGNCGVAEAPAVARLWRWRGSSRVFVSMFMALYSKGISRSALPFRRTPPSWCKIAEDQVVDEIKKYAKKGLTPSQIGVILRDSMGVPQVAQITGNKILRILKITGRREVLAGSAACFAHLALVVQASPPRSRKTSTTLSRRLSTSASTLRSTARTRCFVLSAVPCVVCSCADTCSPCAGLQVPSHSRGEPYPPPRSLLQEEARAAAQLEVRVQHGLCPGRVSHCGLTRLAYLRKRKLTQCQHGPEVAT